LQAARTELPGGVICAVTSLLGTAAMAALKHKFKNLVLYVQ
jgi:hypothetical protein